MVQKTNIITNNFSCRLPIVTISDCMTNITTAVMLNIISISKVMFLVSKYFSPRRRDRKFCKWWYHGMTIEDVTSNTTIAIIMVCLACHEEENWWQWRINENNHAMSYSTASYCRTARPKNNSRMSYKNTTSWQVRWIIMTAMVILLITSSIFKSWYHR